MKRHRSSKIFSTFKHVPILFMFKLEIWQESSSPVESASIYVNLCLHPCSPLLIPAHPLLTPGLQFGPSVDHQHVTIHRQDWDFSWTNVLLVLGRRGPRGRRHWLGELSQHRTSKGSKKTLGLENNKHGQDRQTKIVQLGTFFGQI